MLRLQGKVHEDKEKLENVKIAFISEGEEIDHLMTAKNGRFLYKLPLQQNYFMVFSKRGYRSKYVEIIASSIPPADASFGYEFGGLDVSLFREIQGLDDEVLDKPIGKIIYDTTQFKFIFDVQYFDEIQEKVDSLKAELEEKQENEEELLALETAAFKAAEEEEARLKSEQEEVEKKERQRQLQLQDVEKKRQEELKRKQEELARKKTEEEAIRKAEEERQRQLEETAKKALEEKQQQEELAQKKAEDEARKKEEELATQKTAEETEKKKQEELVRKNIEEAKLKAAEEEARKKEEELAAQKEQEEYEKKKAAYLKAKAKLEAEQRPEKTTETIEKQQTSSDKSAEQKQYPPGLTEEIYRKGNKTITDLIIVEDEKQDIYRKVVADWGGKYYFKNNVSVTEREWSQVTEKYKK